MCEAYYYIQISSQHTFMPMTFYQKFKLHAHGQTMHLLTFSQNPNLMLNHYLRSFHLTPRWEGGDPLQISQPVQGSSRRPSCPILQPYRRFKLGLFFGWHLHSLVHHFGTYMCQSGDLPHKELNPTWHLVSCNPCHHGSCPMVALTWALIN